MISKDVKICPRCGLRLRLWAELDDEQKMIAERLEQSTDHTIEARKRHRFCVRCWFEDASEELTFA